MKSYSVKSNAKRFARGVSAKHPGLLEASEPCMAPGKEWFPAVVAIGDRFADVPADVRETCIIANEEPEGGLVVSFPEEMADEAEDDIGGPYGDPEDEAAYQASKTDFVPPTPVKMPEALKRKQSMGRIARAAEPKAVPVIVDYAAEAAALPPRVQSSREEIDARRAERRARVEAEKAEGTRTATGAKVKINKKKTIIDLVARKGGATQGELETATGWQRHTLRGYIAGTLRKQLRVLGADIECRRGKGEEPTKYMLVGTGAANAAKAEGGA